MPAVSRLLRLRGVRKRGQSTPRAAPAWLPKSQAVFLADSLSAAPSVPGDATRVAGGRLGTRRRVGSALE